MVLSGGTQANYTGNALEQYVEHRLVQAGYVRVRPQQFNPSNYIGQAIYTRHYHAGTSIYNTPIFADFAIYHPKKWPESLIIECKWQQVGGSVDEKYPYLVLNIQYHYPFSTILLLDGGGYKRGAEEWIRSQVGSGRLRQVFNMVQFQTWTNQGNI